MKLTSVHLSTALQSLLELIKSELLPPKDTDGWVKHYLQIFLSHRSNLLGVPDKMGLPYEVWIVEQITEKGIKVTSRHFPAIVLTSWSEASREFHLSQSAVISLRVLNIVYPRTALYILYPSFLCKKFLDIHRKLLLFFFFFRKLKFRNTAGLCSTEVYLILNSIVKAEVW